MTKNHWIHLWVALFVVQAASLWIHRQRIQVEESPVQQIGPGLLELAQKTNQTMQLTTEEPPEIEKEIHERRSDSLVRRESLILELLRLQEQLQEQGVETCIVQDLEAFIGTMDGSESISRINSFIIGILDWIRPHVRELPYCALERLSLFPESGGNLPVLAFELSGTPKSMARSLLWSAGESSRWDLVEMDLLVPGNERSCWLRGSFAFMGNMNFR